MTTFGVRASRGKGFADSQAGSLEKEFFFLTANSTENDTFSDRPTIESLTSSSLFGSFSLVLVT